MDEHATYHLFAPAKINIDLTITGRRADGYHTLRSHAAFADWGDDLTLTITPSDTPQCTLDVTGPFADHIHTLPHADNLAVRAGFAFFHHHALSASIHIDLVKNIPSSAGLGGGSADAAAVLRGLSTHTGLPVPNDLMLALGADVPVCYHAEPCIMEGIGEILHPWPDASTHDAIIIWDRAGPSTKDLYAAFDAAPVCQPRPNNDFETVAIARTPVIDHTLNALRALPHCRMARLTGSGTAVFGLFDHPQTPRPDWCFTLIQSCKIGIINKPLVRRT